MSILDRARALLLLALLTGWWADVTAQDRLPPPVLEAMQSLGLPADALAAVAVPLRHFDRSWRHQADKPMQPGSAMKVLTSVVALDRLGPNHRGFTELRSAAPLREGTLQGDLVLVGGGEVELGVPQLWALLLELQQAGVRRIEGNIVVDRTRYNPQRLDQGLAPFDEAPEFPYNVIPDALMLNEGLLPLELRATDSGVVASTVPRIEGIDIDSRMALVDARCADWDDHWKPAQVQSAAGRTRITLHGAFPRGCTQRARLQLVDRAELTDKLIRTLWQGLGGSWSGSAREAAAPAGTELLARRQGRPWGELLRHLNKTSDNAWTRVLFLELGVPAMAEQPGRSTLALADAAVRQWFAEQRIDDKGLVLDNGSGLSRSERISPWQMAQLLKAAYFGRHASDLIMSLPTVGVDGTMRNRLRTGPAAGWARLKTGTLRNVVALAGFVNDAQGRPWAVAMMVNHDTLAARARPVLDALVEHIAGSGPHPVATLPGPQGDGP
jgi:D-alanyl-D-alanine carboxypeptidase/D-alanyl-D-alanine-endopeptidase (penicillin-binding protein 4)